ncbi:MAG TPA: hypothetical protein VFT48_21695, partial [Pyrinomonadaceae bacterium]|nr:hypothetical protein [Pyrinomonadaceae bacterium]
RGLSLTGSRSDGLGFGEHDQNHGRPRRAAPTVRSEILEWFFGGGGQEGCPPGYYWIARKVNDPVFVGILRKTPIMPRFQIKPENNWFCGSTNDLSRL